MTLSNIKIFIVEDDLFFSSLIETQLKRHDFENIKTFNNGADFLNQLHTNPDIVILDHNLNEMNGLDILRRIKSVNPDIQVIFLSAQQDMEVAVKALKYGAYDYLQKDENCSNRLVHIIARIVRFNNVITQNKSLLRMKRIAVVAAIITLGVFAFINMT